MKCMVEEEQDFAFAKVGLIERNHLFIRPKMATKKSADFSKFQLIIISASSSPLRLFPCPRRRRCCRLGRNRRF